MARLLQPTIVLTGFLLFVGVSSDSDLMKYDVKRDMDCLSSDIGSHADTSPENCDPLCAANANCVGFLYDENTDRCYLKSKCDSDNYVKKDKVFSYTLQREVCTWTKTSNCVDRYYYDEDTFEDCSWRNWESDSTPWCGHHAVYQTGQWSDCAKTCREAINELQYGSVTTLYTRQTLDAVDTAVHYTMVFQDPIGESGWLTTINIDVAKVDRHLSFGVFRKIGTGTCDFMLVKEVPLHRLSAYQPYLQVHGLREIKLNPEDWLPVSNDYHLGHYWNLEGTMEYSPDASELGYQNCGYSYSTLPHVFVPYETIESTANYFHRHYGFDIVIQYSDTDITWWMNAALFMNVTAGGTSHSRKDGKVPYTDGDYSTCDNAGQDTLVVDLNRKVAVSAVKIRSSTAVDLTVTLTDTANAADSTSCGSYQGDWSDNTAVVTCSDGARGRYLELEFNNAAGDVTICEVEATLTKLYEDCIEEECYFVTSEQADSPGAADEMCKRQYADAAVFEPTDQTHWDTVAEWYMPLFADVVDGSGLYGSVVGMKYVEDSWKLQSTGLAPPTIQYASLPSHYTYTVMDAESTDALAEQNGVSHYALCQVSKATYDATSRVVLRAASGCGQNLYDLWSGDASSSPAMTQQFGPDLVSLDPSETSVYLSPIADCVVWSSVKEIRYSMYKDGMEVAFVIFGQGTGRESWFSEDNIKASSYFDLPLAGGSTADSVSIERSGSDGDKYRFSLNQYTFDTASYGWMVVTDYGHQGTDDGPQFLYSNRGSSSSSWKNADLVTITVKLDDAALGNGLDTCKGKADGLYHSALGCNVYVSCDSEQLTYHTCRSGTNFDSTEGECIDSSTTCTAGNVTKSCQTGCPADDPCTAGQGNCTHPDGATGWQCACEDGYEGIFCESEIDECEGVTCSGRGNCTDLLADYVCECGPDSGYEGKDCDTDIVECDLDGFCVNGDCENSEGGYTCTCDQGYTGTACDENIDECQTMQPCVNGICQDNNGSYTCLCGDGYSGQDCDSDIDECDLDDPCMHGQCNNTAGSYECVCESGYAGTNCDADYDECSSNPCVRGTCSNQFDRYSCDCAGTGYEGDNCEITDYCFDHNDCTDNGDCVNGDTAFTCDCNDGYSGDRCEVVNLCIVHGIDCSGNGDCEHIIDSPGWRCDCEDTHIGDTCQLDNPCEPDPCQDNEDGTCEVTSDKDNYYCECGDLIGDSCDITHPCRPDPCVQGTCGVTGSPGDYGYVCGCEDHYTGTNCDKSPCDRVSCNTGTCDLALDTISGYSCTCTDPYIGTHCETNPCANNPCQNGGVCVSNAEKDSGYDCNCGWPYAGDTCTEDVSVNDSAVKGVVISTAVMLICGFLALL